MTVVCISILWSVWVCLQRCTGGVAAMWETCRFVSAIQQSKEWLAAERSELLKTTHLHESMFVMVTQYQDNMS